MIHDSLEIPFVAKDNEAILAAILSPDAVCDEPMYVPPLLSTGQSGTRHQPKDKLSGKKRKRRKGQDVPVQKINYTRAKRERDTASIRTIEQILMLQGNEAAQKLEAAKLGKQWARAGKRSIRDTTQYAVACFSMEMRQGRIVGGLNGKDYWQFVHRQTVAWIAEKGYCNERYERRKDFAAKLHTDLTKVAL